MFRIDAGGSRKYCDGVSRRSFLQVGVAGLATVGLADVFAFQAQAAQPNRKDTSVILIWLDGGPGHMDMYDMKPDAPAEYRGIWRPIRTNVPGHRDHGTVSQTSPGRRQVLDRSFAAPRHGRSLCRRSSHADDQRHGSQRREQGRADFPSIGAIVAHHRHHRHRPRCRLTSASRSRCSIGLRPGYFGGNFLGSSSIRSRRAAIRTTRTSKFKISISSTGLTVDRWTIGKVVARALDQIPRVVGRQWRVRRDGSFRSASVRVRHRRSKRARLSTSARKTTRCATMYGRHNLGTKHAAGPTSGRSRCDSFVTVHFGGWDHHWNLQSGMENYLPQVDAAVSRVVHDLDQRGLLDIDSGDAVRRIQPHAAHERRRQRRPADEQRNARPRSLGQLDVLPAGWRRLKGGQIVGSTTDKGDAPKDNPKRPGDIHHTIYHVLGVDPAVHFLDHQGRPVPAIDHGNVIEELF